jgi:serine/threonine protein phosphatase 1
VPASNSSRLKSVTASADSRWPRNPRGAPGKRCYAIGDVHGRLDLLKDLLQQIARHDASRPERETAIVLLGDLIDRGPSSSEVVEFARTYRPAHARLYVLVGNHEEMMMRALAGDLDAFQTWMANGGLATMRSYGVDTGKLAGMALEDFRQRIADTVPPSHVSFLKSGADSIRFGDYLLVHAGVLPGRPLEEQQSKDLRWIRKAFLSSDFDHGFVVVHGHSQRSEIEVRANRIGIDTGAYHSGVLTAAWIEDDERGFVQTSGPAMDIDDTLFE